MAGFDRYENILRLFSEQRSSWTVADISAALDTSTSTIYRTVRELVGAGLLESTVESHYRLGPAFVEFEHLIRVTDPLIRSGAVFLDPLVEQAGIPATAVLARLYGDRVMCVAEARSPQFKKNTSYERGRPMPILKGATSKAILAGLTGRKRSKLFASIGEPEGVAREELLRELESIRKVGISVTRGEVDKGLMGIAAPVRNTGLGINASLSFIISDADFSEELRPRLFSLLASHSRLIENYMEDAYQDISRRSGGGAVASAE